MGVEDLVVKAFLLILLIGFIALVGIVVLNLRHAKDQHDKEEAE